MKVEVRFFASLRDATGTDRLHLALPDGAGVAELMTALQSRLPPAALAALCSENVQLAVNQTLGPAPPALAEGDEIAFLPPVTGG